MSEEEKVLGELLENIESWHKLYERELQKSLDDPDEVDYAQGRRDGIGMARIIVIQTLEKTRAKLAEQKV